MSEAILIGTNQPQPNILYEDNTYPLKSQITVSQPFSDFERVGIYYWAAAQSWRGYQEICYSSEMSNGCILSVPYLAGDTTNPIVYIRSAWVTFNDKTITFETNLSYQITSTGTKVHTDGNGVVIYKVIGFKY